MFASSHIPARILGRGPAFFRGHGLCTLTLALIATAALTGCGQKGPLFFPPPPKTIPAVGAAPAKPANPLVAPVATPDIPEPPPAAPPTSAPR